MARRRGCPAAVRRASRSPFSRWAARAAACWPTGSSRSPKRRVGTPNQLRCRALRSAPARRSTISRWRRSKDGADPVFALMPTPGDVDVVMASELMEAGRSVLRGLVTPDRTILIASTHRAFAVVEKQAPGDGIADPDVVDAGHRVRREKDHRVRHGGDGEGERKRHIGDDVWRACGLGAAAVRPRRVRGGDPR